MLGHFPIPYPDESFYSVCARYSDRMQYLSTYALIRDLFGTTWTAGGVFLPRRFNVIVSNLPPGYPYTAEYFIKHHTVFPLYRAFMLAERSERLYRQMLEGMSRQKGQSPVFVHHRFSESQMLRFCPACVEGDRLRFGETYWHRVHQAPGVEVCPIHRVWLEQSSARARRRKDKRRFVSAESVIEIRRMRTLDLSRFYHQISLRIASDVAWLLTQCELNITLEFVRNCYAVALVEQGFASPCGQIQSYKFLSALRFYYTPTFLKRLDCDFIQTSIASWPYRTVASDWHDSHPLRHLLVIHFLAQTLEKFLELLEECQPPALV